MRRRLKKRRKEDEDKTEGTGNKERIRANSQTCPPRSCTHSCNRKKEGYTASLHTVAGNINHCRVYRDPRPPATDESTPATVRVLVGAACLLLAYAEADAKLWILREGGRLKGWWMSVRARGRKAALVDPKATTAGLLAAEYTSGREVGGSPA